MTSRRSAARSGSDPACSSASARVRWSKTRSDAGTSADAAALQAKLSSNYSMTSSLLKTGFDSTMTQMAAMRNMTDSYNRWSYRPR